MFLQALSLVGALLVLGAFGLVNTGRTRPQDHMYIAMNFFGAGFLAWVAIADGRIGFILLESAWAVFSLVPLFRKGSPEAVAGEG